MNQDKPKMPPQFNTLTIDAAILRVGLWKTAIEPIYGPYPAKIPHGFFLRMKDIRELAKLNEYLNQEIEGVRVYFTFDTPEPSDDEQPPTNITGILVPVYLGTVENKITGSKDPALLDLIVEVTPPDNKVNDPDNPYVSVFDVTQPCPPLCDPTSKLF